MKSAATLCEKGCVMWFLATPMMFVKSERDISMEKKTLLFCWISSHSTHTVYQMKRPSWPHSQLIYNSGVTANIPKKNTIKTLRTHTYWPATNSNISDLRAVQGGLSYWNWPNYEFARLLVRKDLLLSSSSVRPTLCSLRLNLIKYLLKKATSTRSGSLETKQQSQSTSYQNSFVIMHNLSHTDRPSTYTVIEITDK